ncbi:hypothetical protein ACS0X5_10390 [Burkholderia gladioli]|uniref:hypothetical protein n=1 Tax=Burkholderia gladioli TaxID=28095 RepID=UPI0011D1BEE6|nr:hypothetical protein [Burkholderia gladioli]MBW5285328.1 hypothetical protein [Burkholderia gladioli]
MDIAELREAGKPLFAAILPASPGAAPGFLWRSSNRGDQAAVISMSRQRDLGKRVGGGRVRGAHEIDHAGRCEKPVSLAA